MTLHDESGNVLNKTEFMALTASQPAPEAQFRVTAPIYEKYTLSGEKGYESGDRLRFKSGTVLTQSQIDGMFTAATVASISPATGLAAGNTSFTITGTDLGGVEGVTFGGTPATAVKITANGTKVTGKTPAHAAGAVTVVVKDDSGDVTKTNFYTYT